MIRDSFNKNEKAANPAAVKFLKAVASGDIERVRDNYSASLLNTRAPETGDTPLIIAARDGELDILRFLIHKGACIDTENNLKFTALYKAVSTNQAGSVKRLLDAGAKASATANPWLAITKGNEEITDLLLAAKVSLILASPPDMNQPLHLAAAAGRINIARKLLAAGVPTRTRNAEGKTPADIARAKGYHDLSFIINAEETRRDSVFHIGTKEKTILAKPLQFRKPS